MKSIDIDKGSALWLHLKEINIYDLLRLKDCFQYELETNNANKQDLENILAYISALIEEYEDPA